MSRPNEQHAYFTLSGDFDPEEITRRAGVTPDRCWRAGDLHPLTRMERKASRWSLESRLSRSEPIEAHIADVLDRLDEYPVKFTELACEFDGGMQVVGYFHARYPGLSFDAGLMARLGAYPLWLDLDFYDLWSDSREDTSR